MKRAPLRLLLVASMVAAALFPTAAARAGSGFGDVPTSYWAWPAIEYVAITNPWMNDYTDGDFHPTTLETRGLLARSLVEMFAPGGVPTPGCAITFTDLASTDPLYPYACTAVQLGWMVRFASGAFAPNGPIMLENFDRAVVLALGLTAPVQGLASIHTTAGYRYAVSPWFPYLQLGRTLGLHYDHANAALDLEATSFMPRDETAFGLWRAKTLPPWILAETSAFDSVVLPALNPADPTQLAKQQLTQFALRYVGYPYVWAGEWYRKTPPTYCCGYQPVGGFDCSGFVWWVLKLQGEQGWSNAGIRPYPGWSLPQRTSYDMAKATTVKIPYARLRVGDILMFADSGTRTWQNIDHVGIYLGNGWMIHSVGSVTTPLDPNAVYSDGPQLEYIGDPANWYRQSFAWGRRLIVATGPAPSPSPSPSPSP